MNWQCIVDYMEPLKSCFNISQSEMCFIVAVSIVGFVTICLLLYFFIQKMPSTTGGSSSNDDAISFEELHRATFENDVITSIRLVQKYPQAINHRHLSDGYTPFMRACLNGNTQLVSLMLNLGADTSLKSTKGETPFYLAVFHLIQNPRCKDATCIRTLYYAGSDINATNIKGYTALHLGAMFGHTSLVRWLLSKGACSVVQPFPYVVARLQGHYETAMLLKNRGLPAIE